MASQSQIFRTGAAILRARDISRRLLRKTRAYPTPRALTYIFTRKVHPNA
jgi:hypothetical protein